MVFTLVVVSLVLIFVLGVVGWRMMKGKGRRG